MDKFSVRPGVAGDEEALAAIDLECFPEEPWSVESFRHDLTENPFALYILAEVPEELTQTEPSGQKTVAQTDSEQPAGRIMGYVGVWMIADEGHITNVAVRPAYRGQGLGNTLLHLLEHHCRLAEITALTLEVRPSNATAIRLYERNGFREEGRRKHYYENNGEDAIIMWKRL